MKIIFWYLYIKKTKGNLDVPSTTMLALVDTSPAATQEYSALSSIVTFSMINWWTLLSATIFTLLSLFNSWPFFFQMTFTFFLFNSHESVAFSFSFTFTSVNFFVKLGFISTKRCQLTFRVENLCYKRELLSKILECIPLGNILVKTKILFLAITCIVHFP